MFIISLPKETLKDVFEVVVKKSAIYRKVPMKNDNLCDKQRDTSEKLELFNSLLQPSELSGYERVLPRGFKIIRNKQ